MVKSSGKTERRNNVQLWTTGVASARGAARTAREIEAAGWDGMLVVDSQNLSGDPYVSLALAAAATTRIGLGTGVTNSVTRHAAATATAISSVNRVSNGRAVLGIESAGAASEWWCRRTATTSRASAAGAVRRGLPWRW